MVRAVVIALLTMTALAAACSRGDDLSLALPVPDPDDVVVIEGPPPPPPPSSGTARHALSAPVEIAGFLARAGTDPVAITVGEGQDPEQVPTDVARRLVAALGRDSAYASCCDPDCAAPSELIRVTHRGEVLPLAIACARLYYAAAGVDGPYALASPSMAALLRAILDGAWDAARAVPLPPEEPLRRGPASKMPPPEPPQAPPAYLARFFAAGPEPVEVTLHWLADPGTRRRSGPRVLGVPSVRQVRLSPAQAAEVVAMFAGDRYLAEDVGCVAESIGIVFRRGAAHRELIHDCSHVYTTEALHDGTFFVLEGDASMRLEQIIDGARRRRR